MTTVSQTYTPALNVSITVDDDGNLRGVTKWVSGASHVETERFGTLAYTAPRVSAPKPKPANLSTHEGRVQWLTEHPEAYTTNNGRTGLSISRIHAIKNLRNAARDAGLNVGLLEAKNATEAPHLFPLHRGLNYNFQAWSF